MAGGARLERRPRRLAILTSPAVFLVAIAAIFVLRAQDDPDYWWHLRVGEWIVDNAAVPRTELLSWLSGGGPWTAPSWGSEVVLYLLHGATGTAGSVVLFFLVSLGILAAVAALAHHVRPSLGPGWVAGLVLATAVVAMPVWGARSQLWDVLFALVALLGMLRYLDHGRVRGLIFMPLLMVAWANLHGAGTLVYLLVAAGVIAGEVWNRRAWRHDGPSWRPLLLSVAVTTLAISLNPYGPGLYVYGFTTTASGPTADYVLEWLSPNFHTLGLRPAQLLVAFGLVGVMAFVRVRDARTVALVSGFTFMFLQSGRYLEFLAPVAFGLMGPAMLIGMARILQPIVAVAPALPRRPPPLRCDRGRRARRDPARWVGSRWCRRSRRRRSRGQSPLPRLPGSRHIPGPAGCSASTGGVGTCRTSSACPSGRTGRQTPSATRSSLRSMGCSAARSTPGSISTGMPSTRSSCRPRPCSATTWMRRPPGSASMGTIATPSSAGSRLSPREAASRPLIRQALAASTSGEAWGPVTRTSATWSALPGVRIR